MNGSTNSAGLALFFLSACVHKPPIVPQTWTEALPLLETVEFEGQSIVDLSPFLEIEQKASGLPALAGGLVVGDRLVAIGAAGERRVNTGDAVGLNDSWHMGSVTKSMTATLTAILINEDLLTWETTVPEAFPDQEIAPEWTDVTVLDLSRHLGGAPEPNLLALHKGRTTKLTALEERRDWIKTVVLPEAPRTREFRYTNGNYILLGAMLEVFSGKSWEVLMKEKLFAPLELESAGFGAPVGLNQPWGHLPTSYTGPLPIMPGNLADNPPVLGPAGTVHMSLADLARYAQAHLALAQGRSTLWTGSAFDRLHEAPEKQPKSYASGWVVESDSPEIGGHWIHHNGSNGYWLAKIGIAPDANKAFVCASNFFDLGEADRVCGAFFERLNQLDGLNTGFEPPDAL